MRLEPRFRVRDVREPTTCPECRRRFYQPLYDTRELCERCERLAHPNLDPVDRQTMLQMSRGGFWIDE